jgi:hypothetical protein
MSPGQAQFQSLFKGCHPIRRFEYHLLVFLKGYCGPSTTDWGKTNPVYYGLKKTDVYKNILVIHKELKVNYFLEQMREVFRIAGRKYKKVPTAS